MAGKAAARRRGARAAASSSKARVAKPRAAVRRRPVRATAAAAASPKARAAPRRPVRRPIKVLVAKLGLDGHDRGALVLCRAFRDAGMEVVYSGLFATPDRVAQMAEDEDADAVALSLLNGAHGTLFPRVVGAIRKKGINDVLVVGGGVIPDADRKALVDAGISGVFGPGTPLPEVIEHIAGGVRRLRNVASAA